MEGIVIAVIGAVVTLVSIITIYIRSRADNKVAAENAKTALDKRIDERVSAQLESAWARIDDLESGQKSLEARETRRTGAITRILRAIANQWPGPHGPDLDPADIAEIEDSIPLAWIRRKPEPQ